RSGFRAPPPGIDPGSDPNASASAVRSRPPSRGPTGAAPRRGAGPRLRHRPPPERPHAVRGFLSPGPPGKPIPRSWRYPPQDGSPMTATSNAVSGTLRPHGIGKNSGKASGASRLVFGGHLAVEPGAGERPVAVGGGRGDAEDAGGLVHGQAGEVAQFHEGGLV